MKKLKVFDEEFEIKEIPEGFQAIHIKSGALFHERFDKKELIKDIKKFSKEQLKALIQYRIKVKEKNELWDRSKEKFKQIFKEDLDKFIDYIFWQCNRRKSIDVVYFDQWLQTPKGISTNQYVKEKYGDEAVELINSLI